MSDAKVEDIFLRISMLEAGLVPLTGANLNYDVNKALADLPPDEARKMKRKFRKLWRKLTNRCRIFSANGNPQQKPDRRELLYRKRVVVASFSRDAKRSASNILKKEEKGR